MHDLPEIITHSDRIEAILEPWHHALGDDLDGYRGHIYRVLNYALFLLDGDRTFLPEIETALAYHDLGLWADRTLAYLEPSIDRALRDNASQGWHHEPQLLRDIILWHHKVTRFKGPHANVVNAVRKADWVDATAGVLRKGIPRRFIHEVKEAIPAAGFYDTLRSLGTRLNHGDRVQTFKDLTTRVLKW